MQTIDVAVIGGGASGALVAAWLLRHARGPLRIALIERTGRFGTGVAYGTRDPAHLLNVPAGKMSADPDRPGHLVEWARRRGHEIDEGTFVPRALYGDYLQDYLAGAEVAARDGVRLLRVPREVVRVQRGRVLLETGEVLRAQRVVLATGHLPPAPPPVRGVEAVLDTDAWYPDAWSPRLRTLPREASVLVLGTGLSAIDVALTLRRRDHQGEVVLLSRRGQLPLPHGEEPSAPLPLAASGSPLSVLRTVRRAAARAALDGGDWRSVVDGLRARSQAIWREWSPRERARFDRHLRAYWDAHRHRMAPELAAEVSYLLGSERLEVIAGRVEGMARIGDAIRVTLRRRGSQDRELHLFDAVVNCLGPLQSSAAPPISGLVEDGLARLDRFGLVTEGGRVADWLYAIGPLRRSELWETTAIPEIRVQARELADALLESLSPAREQRLVQ